MGNVQPMTEHVYMRTATLLILVGGLAAYASHRLWGYLLTPPPAPLSLPPLTDLQRNFGVSADRVSPVSAAQDGQSGAVQGERPLPQRSSSFAMAVPPAVEKALLRRLPPTLNCDGTLGEAFDAVSEAVDVAGPEPDPGGPPDRRKGRTSERVRLSVEWRRLREAGFSSKTPVRAALGGMTLADAILAILGHVDPQRARLACTSEENSIVLTLIETTQIPPALVVYDVRDILADRPGTTAATAAVAQQRAASLVQRLTATIAPQTWRQNGGCVGNVVYVKGQLVVTQTTLNQRGVEEFLYGLRLEQRRPLADGVPAQQRHPHCRVVGHRGRTAAEWSAATPAAAPQAADGAVPHLWLRPAGEQGKMPRMRGTDRDWQRPRNGMRRCGVDMRRWMRLSFGSA